MTVSTIMIIAQPYFWGLHVRCPEASHHKTWEFFTTDYALGHKPDMHGDGRLQLSGPFPPIVHLTYVHH